jgi:hypothetical protein
MENKMRPLWHENEVQTVRLPLWRIELLQREREKNCTFPKKLFQRKDDR